MPRWPCSEDFLKNLILSVRSLLPVGPLVEEVGKRNRLKMLTPFLEHLVSEVRPGLPGGGDHLMEVVIWFE